MDTPDVRQLSEEKLPEAAFPAGGRRDFRVHFDKAVHARIAAHAAEKTSVEICGVLVGDWQQDRDGPFVNVSDSIRCDSATSRAGEVTFTHDAWNFINREMDTRFAALKIVGWYHSHPTFGIFLSERDCFIQQHFFSSPGQVAYVVDPVGKSEGVFVWRKGKPKACSHFWVGDRVRLSTEAASEEAAAPPPGKSPRPPAADLQPFFTPAGLRTLLYCCLVLAIGYFLGGMNTAWEQNRLVEGVVAHYGLFPGLRPGLHERLATADDDLAKIAAVVAAQAKEHVELAGDGGAEKKKQWDAVSDALLQTRGLIREIDRLYSLSPEESAIVERMIRAKLAELQGMREKPAGEAAKPPPPPAAKSPEAPKEPSEPKK